MSDDDNENYSDDNSEFDNNSDNEGIIISNKKPLFKPSINIKSIGETKFDSEGDSEEEDEDEDDEDEDEQTGGVGDNGDELDIDDADPDEDEEDEDTEDEDIELDEDGEPIIKESVKKNSKLVKPKKITQLIVEDDEDDEDDEYDESYLQKFDAEITKNYINDFHPECFIQNYDEIAKLATVVRNSDNIIIDPNHRTIPYLTKYERARILGQRAKQIETGAKPLVKIPENIVDSYIIAELELREKKIPFIIRRPIPGGACEYWNLRDLEVIAF